MKKFYIFCTALLSVFIFAQSPIITMISDGDCTGGTPKVVEIYANGTVDFSLYSIENQTNDNTTWGNTQDLSSLGTVTDVFVYVFYDGSYDNFSAEYPGATTSLESSTVNVNGDDRVRIVLTSSSAVIDQFGEEGVDGTDKFWEYLDGYARRVDGMGPNATFTESEWIFAKGALNNLGLCQGGTDSFEVLTGAGTYMATASTEPSIMITDPAEGATLPLGTTEYTFAFTVNNFTIPADGHIHATIDGANAGDYTYYTADPITLTGLTTGSHTLKLQLTDASHTPLTPDVFDEVNFTIPVATEVADLAALRADVVANGVGGYYTITGEVMVSYVVEDAQTGAGARNQRYVQDATGGLLLDDLGGVLAEVQGDGIIGLVVKSAVFAGVLEGIPQSDPGANSTGNAVDPMVVSIPTYVADSERYESVLIEFENVTFAEGGNEVVASTNYNVSDGTDSQLVRAAFDLSDIIGTTLPTAPVRVAVIGAEYNGTLQPYLRNAADVTIMGVDDVQALNDKVQISNTLVKESFNVMVEGNAQVDVYNMNGQLVKTANGSDVITIQANGWSQGAYIVKVSQDGQSVSKQILKQ